MKNTKLISLLKNLNSEELNELEKFSVSPYLNRGRNTLPLLKLLRKFHPEFNDEKLTDEYLIKNLFPGRKTDDRKAYSLLKTNTSELFILCKDFLSYSEFKKDTNRKNLYLLNQLRTKKLLNEFEKEFKAAEEYQIKNEQGSADDFVDKYFLTKAYAEYCVETGKTDEFYNSHFKMTEYSVIFALIKSFRLTEIRQVSKSFGQEDPGFNLGFFLVENLNEEKFIEGLKKNDNRYYPLIEMSYLIHKMTVAPDSQKYYYELKKLFDKHLDILGHSEKYTILGIMGSYCIIMQNKTNLHEFSEEQFKINDRSLKLGVYKWRKEDDFHISHFRNIVLTALSLNHLDWLEDFIHGYSDELNINLRDNMKLYCLALLYHARKEYGKALENLIRVKYDFFMFKIDIKNLYFRIYYETDQTEQCFSVLDSMKHYISYTKDLNSFFKKRNNAFIRYAGELLRIKSSGNHKIIDEFIFRIRNEKSIESRRWLIEKSQELLNS